MSIPRPATLSLLVLSAILSGCSSATPQVPEATNSPPASSQTTARITTGSPVNISDYDSSHALGIDETAELYKGMLENEAKSMGLNPVPRTKLVRYIKPSELGATMVACLAEFGMPAKETPDGYELGDIPDSQGNSANEAQYICQARYPMHPQYMLKKSNVALGKEYDYLVSNMLPCLRGLGYTVSDPPTKEVWISSYGSGPWSPDQDLSKAIGADQGELTKARTACPGPRIDSLIEHPPALHR